MSSSSSPTSTDLQPVPEPDALIFSLDSTDIVDGVGTLLMAELDGEPVGCGAFRVMDNQPGSAEIKRMYVTLAGRGKKLGFALLAELERAAAAIGVRRLVLETGPRQPEALQIYERAGYAVCEPWGLFVGREFSICMEKMADRLEPGGEHLSLRRQVPVMRPPP
jgi:GNAT superfamily N-acetyltransferase